MIEFHIGCLDKLPSMQVIDNYYLKHLRRQTMYEQFAELKRREAKVLKDKEIAQERYNQISEELRKLSDSDWEIGVHHVVGGHVVVIDTDRGPNVDFFPENQQCTINLQIFHDV